MSRFCAPSEPARRDYERLRCAVLATGCLPDELAAARFARRGLGGLIAWPDAEPVFRAELVGASRPAWTPYADPRIEALAAAYRLLLDTDTHGLSGADDAPAPPVMALSAMTSRGCR
jgi:hypothetical protein